jgi:hypothetical protein
MTGMDLSATGRHSRRSRVVIGVLVTQFALIVLLGFVLFRQFDERHTNVVPGERDYPERNTQPSHSIQVTFFIPASLHPRFYAIYTATAGHNTSPTPPQCHYAVRTGTATEYSVSLHEFYVDVPLELEYVSNEVEWLGSPHSREMKKYSAKVVVDRYRGDRCGWNFDSVLFVPDNYGIEPVKVFRLNEVGRYGFDGPQSELVPSWINFWCTRLSATPEWPSHEVCVGPRGGDIKAHEIIYGERNYAPLVISKRATKLIFELHNVDDPAPPKPSHYIVP